MQLLILSLLVGIVGGCIPQGFDGTGLINIVGPNKCYKFNFTVSCADVRQTPVMTPESMKMPPSFGKAIQSAWLSSNSIYLDHQCCIHQLGKFALDDGFGIVRKRNGNYEIRPLSEDEPSGNVRYGPHEESAYKNATLNGNNADNAKVVREFLSNYFVPRTHTVGRPMISFPDLVRHAYIQESTKTDGCSAIPDDVEPVIKPSDKVTGDSIKWIDTMKEKKIVSKLLTVVAIGILGLEAVVFMLAILVVTLPEDEQEILESIGLLFTSDEIETRDASVQAIDVNQKTRQNPEQAAPKSTSSSKSVPALSKNKKVQKKNRAKSTIGQMNKKMSMPMIQEDDLDEISSSNA